MRWVSLLRSRTAAGLAVALALLRPAVGAEAAPADLPDAREVIRGIVARAKAVSEDASQPVCSYRNLTVYETLDADGDLRKSKEKIYEVTIRRGMTSNRLISVNGRELSAAESEALSERERKWRDTYVAGEGGAKPRSMDRMAEFIDERLFERFEIRTVGREIVRGRDCLLLDLRPREGPLPEERLIDRVINLLHGRIWVDAGEHEIARAEVRTVGTLRLWGGFLGALEFLSLHVDRERSEVGVWYNRHLEVLVKARKVFSRFQVRAREVGGNLQVVPDPASAAAP